MMKRRSFENEKGIALLTAIILLFLLGTIASTFMILTTTDVRISSNQALASRLLFISEAGISEILSRLASGDTNLSDTTVFQNPDWRAEIHLTRDDDLPDSIYRSPTRQSGDTLPYVSSSHFVKAEYLKNAAKDSIFYFDVKEQKRVPKHKDEPPTDPFLFPIVRIESTALMAGMKRTIEVETTMKRTNPWVEGALNFGGHAEFTGSTITFFGNGAVNHSGFITPLVKKEKIFPYDIYVDIDEDSTFDRGTEWGFYAIKNSSPDSLGEYDWNLDRLAEDARIDLFGVPNTDWAEWPEVSFSPSEFKEQGDLIANGNVIFKNTPRIHGKVLAHGDVEIEEDTLSYVTGGILSDQPPRPLLFIDFQDTTYWKDSLEFHMVRPESLGNGSYVNWNWISSSKTAQFAGGTFEGKHFFMEPIQTILIDNTLVGIVDLATPGNVMIRKDIVVPSVLERSSDFSLILSQYNISLSGDKLFIRAGLYSQFGNLVVEGKNPVIHGFVMVGGSGSIDKDLVIILMDVFHSKDFSESVLFRKINTYNMTTLSWREVNR